MRPQRGSPGRVELWLDEVFHCGVALEAVHEHGLRVGVDLPADVVDRLGSEDECWRATRAALSLLAARSRSRSELVDRLRRKRFGAVAVDHVVAGLERQGLLDDAAFADAWVRDRLRLRPRGARALAAELARKGVAADVAARAIARVMAEEGTRDDALCMAAARRWLQSRGGLSGDRDERRRQQRRLAAFLGRRGYAPADIQAALRAARHD